MARIALAGGTGGHVYPAIAIGDVLRERGHEVLYYGDEGRLEGRVAPQQGYTFRSVRALQYPRSGVLGKVRFALGLLRSTLATRGLLKQTKLISYWGLVDIFPLHPCLRHTMGLGRIVHESNVVPGLANKLCARVAHEILLNFTATASRIGGRSHQHVGMPVNPRVLNQTDGCRGALWIDASVPVVLFVGGCWAQRALMSWRLLPAN